MQLPIQLFIQPMRCAAGPPVIRVHGYDKRTDPNEYYPELGLCTFPSTRSLYHPSNAQQQRRAAAPLFIWTPVPFDTAFPWFILQFIP